MQKIKTRIILIMLLAITISITLPHNVNASTGSATASPTSVAAGGTITIDVSSVTWSGAQVYLLISSNGFSEISSGDVRFSPTFNVVNVESTTPTIINDATYGTWTIGNDQMTGVLPTNIAGGDYYIKVFDGSTTFVAVSNAVSIIPSFTVTPTTGTSGQLLTLNGHAFPANSLVNLTYINPLTATTVKIASLIETDSLGQFTYVVTAPDLKQSALPGTRSVLSIPIVFHATVNATGVFYTATYTANQRGLAQFSTQFSGSDYLFGNNTRFEDTPYSLSVGVGQSITIAGQYFYPGTATLTWDSSTPLGTTTVNSTGGFNTTFTVPVSARGTHTVTITDANNVVFQVTVNVGTSIVLTPEQGSVGTIVTVKGYGFEGSTAKDKYNATITWYGWAGATEVAKAITDVNGFFQTTFIVPEDYGGLHSVAAEDDASSPNSAPAEFTVTPSLNITPSTFANGDQLIEVTGHGFLYDDLFNVDVDNSMLCLGGYYGNIWVSGYGNFSFSFVGTGFRPGQHVVSLYQCFEYGAYSFNPVAWTTFTVTTEGDAVIDAINGTLVSIADGIVTIQTDTTAIQTSLSELNAKLVSIEEGCVTLQTSVGIVKTTLDGINAKLVDISDGVVTLQTSIGCVQTSLDAINAKLVSIDNGVATLQTDLGTIQTDVQTIQTASTNTDSNTSSMAPLIYIAIIFSIVAALAAIMSLLIMRKKIAS